MKVILKNKNYCIAVKREMEKLRVQALKYFAKKHGIKDYSVMRIEILEPMDININDESLPEIITDECEHGKRKVYFK